jgi:hypothetical protein
VRQNHRAVDRDDLIQWVEAYERAWRTPGTDTLNELFTPTATYRAGPFEPEVAGLEAIAMFWEAERDGADEVFSLRWAPVAVEGRIAVARAEVEYAGPPARVYRDLWIVELEDDGRCAGFEEWPFFPGQPLSATTDGA